MKKKLNAACAVLLLLVAICLVHVGTRPSEPQHLGRKLSAWLEDLDTRKPAVQRERAAGAVRAMGTNCLPVLLRIVGSEKSTLLSRARELGRYQTTFEFTPYYVRRCQAVCAFRALGSMAAPAIPALAEQLNHDEDCATAVLALVAIGHESVPVLRQALTNQSAYVRSNAAWGLAKLKISV